MSSGSSVSSVSRARAKILGHDRLQTTAIYLNFTDTHIQEEFERKW
jgi:integrase/recombinase XerD